MRKWLSETVARGRAASRRGAAPDSGDIPNEGEIMQEHETVEDVLDKKGAGRKLLCRAATLIEYSLLISVVSLVVVTAGPPVAEAIQGQFTKVANVISNGSTGGTGGGSDFPGGGSGGGSGSDQGGTGGDNTGGTGGNQGGSGGDSGDTGDKTDTDGDGIPDSEDAYPNDPNNGTGDRDGDGIMDKDDQYPDDPLNGKPAVSRLIGTVSVSDCTVGLTSTAVCSDAPSGAVLQYKWFIDGAEASTGPTRAFTRDDLNKNVYVAVSDTAGKFEGQVTSPIQRVSAREMSGTATFGSLVAGKPATAHISGAPSGANLKFTWYADGVIVSSEQTFTPAAEHVGKSVYVEVTDKNGVYTGSVASSAKIVAEDESTKPVENKLTGSLSIGDCVVGLTTTAFASDIPADAQLEFTWSIGGVSTGGETHAFTLDEADAEVRVTAVDGSGKYSGKLYSNVVRVKTRSITGMVSFAEAIVDKDLSAILNGVPTDIAAKDLKYSWTLNGSEVGTSASYTPKTDDIGGVLVLEVKDGSGKYAGSLISQSQIVRTKSASEGGGGSDGGITCGKPFTGSISILNGMAGSTASVKINEAPEDCSLAYEWVIDRKTVSRDATYTIPDNMLGHRLCVMVTDATGTYSGHISEVITIGLRGALLSASFPSVDDIEWNQIYSEEGTYDYSSANINSDLFELKDNMLVVKQTGTYKIIVKSLTAKIENRTNNATTPSFTFYAKVKDPNLVMFEPWYEIPAITGTSIPKNSTRTISLDDIGQSTTQEFKEGYQIKLQGAIEDVDNAISDFKAEFMIIRID